MAQLRYPWARYCPTHCSPHVIASCPLLHLVNELNAKWNLWLFTLCAVFMCDKWLTSCIFIISIKQWKHCHPGGDLQLGQKKCARVKIDLSLVQWALPLSWLKPLQKKPPKLLPLSGCTYVLAQSWTLWWRMTHLTVCLFSTSATCFCPSELSNVHFFFVMRSLYAVRRPEPAAARYDCSVSHGVF